MGDLPDDMSKRPRSAIYCNLCSELRHIYLFRRTVYVGNLPDDLSDMELAEYFCDLGQVLSAQIRGNDGAHFGFVEFTYPEHVQHVLSLADQQPFMMGDSYLRVQPRRAKEHCQV